MKMTTNTIWPTLADTEAIKTPFTQAVFRKIWLTQK